MSSSLLTAVGPPTIVARRVEAKQPMPTDRAPHRSPPLHIVAFLPLALARTRLTNAVSRGGEARHWSVQFVCSAGELHAALARCTTAIVVVLDIVVDGVLDVASAATLRTAFPTLRILPYSDFRRVRPTHLLGLARLRFDTVITLHEDDDATAFSEALDCSSHDTTEHEVRALLGDRLPPALHGALDYLLGVEGRHPTVTELADSQACHAKTLRARLRRTGCPPPEQLIVWTRLFQAASLLNDPGRTVEGIAETLGFPSATSLRNQFKRYVGVAPRQVGRRGGVPMLVDVFLRCREVARSA